MAPVCVCVGLQFTYNSLKIHLQLQYWMISDRCYQVVPVYIHRGKVIVFVTKKQVAARRESHKTS